MGIRHLLHRDRGCVHFRNSSNLFLAGNILLQRGVAFTLDVQSRNRRKVRVFKKKERVKIVREIVEIQPFRLFIFHEKIGTEFIYSILLEIFKIFRVSEILI